MLNRSVSPWSKCIRTGTRQPWVFRNVLWMARSRVLARPSMSEADITMPTGRGLRTVPTGDGYAIGKRNPKSGWIAAVRNSLQARVFSFPAMLATFLVGAVYVAGRSFAVDPDLWWHIRTGELILDTHRWPTTDPYSFT